MKEFQMGSNVQCLATGFKGMVVARYLFASGTVQYGYCHAARMNPSTRKPY